jgi:hypothetical protein
VCRRLVPLAGLLALAASGAARAQVQIVVANGLAPPEPANVVDADFAPFVFDVFVRNVGCGESFPYDAPCASPGAPTTVALVDGGQVHEWLGVYDTSVLEVTGGSALLLRAAGASTAWLSGGLVENTLQAQDRATVFLRGTGVGQFVYAIDHAALAIEAGTFGQILPAGSSHTRMTGGTAALLAANGFATVDVEGGVVTSFLSGVFASRVHLRGGRVGGELAGNDSAALVWSGGVVEGRLKPYGSATLTVLGSGFAVDGVPVGDGLLPAQEGILSGTLASGEAFATGFCHDGCIDEFLNPVTGRIRVPEPSGGLGGAAAVALAALRRRPRLRGAAS